MGKVNQLARDTIEEIAERLIEDGADPETAQEDAERRVYGSQNECDPS